MIWCCDEDAEYFDAVPSNGGVLPRLDLRACTKLHAVSFAIFVPDGVEVVQGCSFSLAGSCRFLTGISSACTSCICVANDAEELSRFRGATFTALTCLKIDATVEPIREDEDGFFAALDVQLGDNVRHLKSLSILNHPNSRGINLDILGQQQLTFLEVLTEGELNLNISDVASLAATLQMYRIICNRHHSEHAQLQMLQCAINSLNKGGSYLVSRVHPEWQRAIPVLSVLDQ